ncbi:MAG: hypothetical protein AB7V16_07360 [Vulcanibacillus sp.]
MPNDVYSQVLKFQSELDEDEVETFLYDESDDETEIVNEDFDPSEYEGYILEDEDEE